MKSANLPCAHWSRGGAGRMNVIPQGPSFGKGNDNRAVSTQGLIRVVGQWLKRGRSVG